MSSLGRTARACEGEVGEGQALSISVPTCLLVYGPG